MGRRGRERARRAPGAEAVVRLREMRPADVSQVVAIENATSATPWARSMFLGELGRPTSLDLVAAENGQVLGYMMSSRQAEVWHILNLCVAAAERRRGLGERLMAELFRRAAQTAHLGFTLEVRVSNDTAIRLYHRLGFLDQGVRPGYYSDNNEDALIMWRGDDPNGDGW